MQRIMIIGQPGSGKSTLAAAIGRRTGLPVVHIDQIHWRPGWVERSREEKTRLCREVEARAAWVFEGGHCATWDTRVARADLLVWIDRALPLRLWRILRRTVTGLGRTRPDVAEECPERLERLPEFISFIWRTRQSGRAQIKGLVETAPPTCRVVHLRSNREAAAFLASFEGDASSPAAALRS